MPKAKKRQPERLSSLTFVLLFVLSYMVAPTLAFISPLLPIVWVFLAQGILLKWQFGWSFRNWFSASMLSLGLVYLLSLGNMPLSSTFIQTSGSVMLTAIFQYAVLRQTVQNAWLWILAVGAASLVTTATYNAIIGFALSQFAGNIQYVTLFTGSVVGLFQGLILASTLLLIVRTSLAQSSNNLTNRRRDDNNLLLRLSDHEQAAHETHAHFTDEIDNLAVTRYK